jgi:hypothetical protein
MRRFKRSLKTSDLKRATKIRDDVKETIVDILRNRAALPPGLTPNQVWAFLLSGGQLIALPPVARLITLANLFSEYRASYPETAKEASTLRTERTHLRHFEKHLGGRLAIQELTTEMVDRYMTALAICAGSEIRQR